MKGNNIELADSVKVVPAKNDEHELSEDDEDLEPCFIYLNDPQANKDTGNPDNSITTSKYNILTFLPLNLFEQFRRLANLYFLSIIAVQFIPDVTPFWIGFSIMPLVFILGVTAIKDGFEDYYRHAEDERNNSLPTLRLNTETCEWEEIPAKEVVVGDMLKVAVNEEVPADCVCVGSSSEDGSAYINTASLDGENAPKSRRGVGEISKLKDLKDLAFIKGEIECKPNTKDLEGFTGVLKLIEDPALRGKIDFDRPIPVTDSEFYYRGALVSTVDYVYLLVLFVGIDTKMMLNRGQVPFKFARFEQLLNRSVVGLLVFNFFFILILSLYGHFEPHPDYVDPDGEYNTVTKWYVMFFKQMVIFSYMIPLSLYVTVEIVKLGEAMYIFWDRDMAIKQPRLETGPDGEDFEYRFAGVKSMALNEELGMVKYIFSDKTGTLTQNKMELSKVSIAGQAYENDLLSSINNSKNPLSALTAQICQYGASEPKEVDLKLACHFMRNLLICGSILPQTLDAAPSGRRRQSVNFQQELSDVQRNSVLGRGSIAETPKYVYTSPSPDEIAFAEAMATHGIVATQRKNSPSAICVDYESRDSDSVTKVEYIIDRELGFTSSRARMSVISKHVDKVTGDERYTLYSKGADSKIKVMLAKGQELEFERVNSQLEAFAREGCRTLLLAYRELDLATYKQFVLAHNAAVSDVFRKNQLEEEAFESIEQEMTLLGCTAVDDQLQTGVPDCIASLKAAGIKITVLTGDKEETAQTIAKQANIVTQKCIDKGYLNIIKNQKNMTDLFETVEGRQQLQEVILVQLEEIKDAIKDIEEETALLISGASLELAIELPIFFDLMKKLSTIVCYRANPSQKALVVDTAKLKLDGGVCLAIGDGANDVSMIQSSNVGVGIQGQEGSQAALSADFVLHRFRHLKRLLLVHGRFNFYRTAKVVVFSFYKNIVFIFPVGYMAFWNLGSTQQLYEGGMMSVFNVCWASLPPFAIGLWEMDIPMEACLEHPVAFKEFVENPWFNLKMFTGWMLLAIYHSLVVFFVCYLNVTGNGGIWLGNGWNGDMYSWGNQVFWYTVTVVNFKMLAGTTNYTWPIIVSGLIGPVTWILCGLFYSSFVSFELNYYGTIWYITQSYHFYMTFPMVLFVCCMPSVAYSWYARETSADLRTILYEAYIHGYAKSKTTKEVINEYLRRGYKSDAG